MDLEEKIVSYLREKYNPRAIVLYGSRASNKSTSQSDWDFAILLDHNAEGGPEEVEKQSIDADIVKLPISQEEIIKEFDGTLQKARVVFDMEGEGEAFLKAAQEVYSRGRNLTDQELTNRSRFINRRLKKLQDNRENPGVFFYHLGVFYEKAIQYWFEILQNRWRLSPGTALKIIQEEDPIYFGLLKTLYSNETLNEKLVAAEKIQAELWKNRA